MRTAVLLLMLIALPAQMALAGPEKELEALDHKFIQAFNKKDVDSIVKLYAKDATTMDPGPALWKRGHKEIREGFKEMVATMDALNLRIHDTTYAAEGNIGYAYGLFDLSFKDTVSGEAVELQGRFLSVSKKQDGKWVYVVDHASMPFAPPVEVQTSR